MKFYRVASVICVLLVLLALVSCAGNQSGSPPAKVAKGEKPASATIDQRPERDTVDWQFVDNGELVSWSAPVDREWPGEAIGVIGPIIAMGGSGSKSYAAVYDPAGVFIGAVYLKEARKDPSRLENLIRLAQARGIVQNSQTIDRAALLRFINLVKEARTEERP
ncbi:MAG: hypothetical protein QNJ17_14385 [Desulfocapsaceae bacterium]|nr:hypothetical protein [Desulfocapsaceae bacterium]